MITVDALEHNFPLLRLWDRLNAEKKSIRLLVSGEGSIGKTTSLRLLESVLMIRGINCVFLPCKHLDQERITKTIMQLDSLPRDTVIMLDAYDELPLRLRDSFESLLESLSDRKFHVIVTSRFVPQKSILHYYKTAHVQRFSQEQVWIILRNHGMNSDTPQHRLLENTLFLAHYLELLHLGHEPPPTVDDEASFLEFYFQTLWDSKDEWGNSFRSWVLLGRRIFTEFRGEVSWDEIDVPLAYQGILCEWKEDGQSIIDPQHMAYGTFFAAFFLKNRLEQLAKGYQAGTMPVDKLRSELKELFHPAELDDDKRDLYVYAGQLLRKSGTHVSILGMLDRHCPKIFHYSYTHVLYVYMGANQGRYNCGEIGPDVFDPLFFGLCTDATKAHTWATDSNLSYYIENFVFPTRHIAKYAFFHCRWLTEITVPPHIITIQPFAFSECERLTHVTLCEGVQKIRVSAFSDCAALRTVKLPDSLSTLEASVFAHCRSLKHIHLPPMITEIAGGTFACSGLEHIDIPKTVETIHDCAFQSCDRVSRITLREGLREIGTNAFSSLSSDSFPNGVIHLTVPNSVERIGNSAFDFSLPAVLTFLGPHTKLDDVFGLKWQFRAAPYEIRDKYGHLPPDLEKKLIRLRWENLNSSFENLTVFIPFGTRDQFAPHLPLSCQIVERELSASL